MSRSLREQDAGVYHLVNRGVGLGDVFLSTEDKLFFIQLVCDYAKEHAYILHAYALVNNGYNLLLETSRNNLSLIMKLINALYTVYFNKKYGRRGHLWEGRFKSWNIKDESLVLDIVAYIEHLPIYTGVCSNKEASYASSYRQFIGLDKRLVCLTDSIVFQKFNSTEAIKLFFTQTVNIRYINTLHEKLKEQSRNRENKKAFSLPRLKKSDFNNHSKEKRDLKIYQFYKDGYSQSAIGKVLGISQQAVHSIIKRLTQI